MWGMSDSDCSPHAMRLHKPCCPPQPVSCLGLAGSSRSCRCRLGWPLLYLSSNSAASALQPPNPGKWIMLEQEEQRSNQLLEGHPSTLYPWPRGAGCCPGVI